LDRHRGKGSEQEGGGGRVRLMSGTTGRVSMQEVRLVFIESALPDGNKVRRSCTQSTGWGRGQRHQYFESRQKQGICKKRRFATALVWERINKHTGGGRRSGKGSHFGTGGTESEQMADTFLKIENGRGTDQTLPESWKEKKR